MAELVLRGGRVLDPGSGLDAVRDVAIDAGRITAIDDDLRGDTVVDVSGLAVAPGFIDLHSHAQHLAGRRLQAFDGVTTALELEGGRAPIDLAYAREAADGSPINYGFSASWGAARMAATTGITLDGGFGSLFRKIGDPEWQRAATPKELAAILGRLAQDVAAGSLGIGILSGYAPGVDPDEYLAVAQLASDAGVPTFTHCRDLIEFTPATLIDGAEEIVRAAGTTGAHMHYCHVNSTSVQHVDRVLALVERCRAEGGRITTEAYPYGSGATGIGAAFLAPERLRERGLKPSSLICLPSGERIADEARLRELRETDPGCAVIVEFFDERDPDQMAVLRKSLAFPDAIVASDAMPVLGASSGDAWPVVDGSTHPRTAGCFSRALRVWREEGYPLLDAVRRCTVLPAGVLAPLRNKGRLQAGADADVVVFDADRITDQATYLESTRPSVGMRHVLVNGEFVVRDGALVPDARPGRPVRA
jgi:cytosine/adenosine deaminase-related metal-dependent hydrolase